MSRRVDGVPFQHGPVEIRRGQRRAAKSADERVTGAGGEAEPPGGQAPGDCGEERVEDGEGGDGVRIDQADADGGRDGGAHEGADQVAYSRE